MAENDKNTMAEGSSNAAPEATSSPTAPKAVLAIDSLGTQPSGNSAQDATEAAGSQPGEKKGMQEDSDDEEKRKKERATKLGMLALLAKQSFKAALAPTVGLAILQSSVVTGYFTNVGYLMPIASIFAVPMLPRARFMQGLAVNTVLVCLSAAVNLLAMYTCIEARKNTTVPGATAAPLGPGLPPYNSSQSAVAAIWLFVQVWCVNTARARWPSLMLPAVVYTIIASSALSSVVVMTQFSLAERLIRQMLVAMLGAFALALAASLLVFPLSCRTMAFGKVAQLMEAFKGILCAQVAHAGTYAGSGDEGSAEESPAEKEGVKKQKKAKKRQWGPEEASPEAQALRDASQAAIQLFGALGTDIETAQSEFFWGKLRSGDLKTLQDRLRDCLIPISGMQSVIDISTRALDEWSQLVDDDSLPQSEQPWARAIAQLQEPLAILTGIVAEGLDHGGMVLEIIPKPKGDTKMKGAEEGSRRPGDAGFAQTIEARLETLKSQTRAIARSLTRAVDEAQRAAGNGGRLDNKRSPPPQLLLFLHMDTLMQATAQSILTFVQFADSKVADGTMAHNRLVFPNWFQLRTFFSNIFSRDETQAEQGEDTVTKAPLGMSYMGDSFTRHRDPEHLPATTVLQKLGTLVSKIWHFIGSEESANGLRAACAVMSVAIVNYLEPSQYFFLQHRLVWAETIIILGMATSTGANLFGLVIRIVGTAAGMVAALLSWYIPNQNVPGILVVQFILMLVLYACVMLFPTLLQGFFIAVVTTVMITGYELQIGVLGPAALTTGLQEYLPIYELAPYRLATVVVGCLVGFIWTVFPYPVTERRIIRIEMARVLYLLAETSGVTHSSIEWHVNEKFGLQSAEDKEALEKLAQIREKLFRKLFVALPDLRQHVDLQKWEPVLGGPWPADVYKSMIVKASRITNCLSLASYISFHAPDLSEEEMARWKGTSEHLLAQMKTAMHSVTSVLALASSSLHSGRSLPPFIPLPKANEMEPIFRALPNMSTLADEDDAQLPNYAAFAVREVCLYFVGRDLKGLVDEVSKLVGTVDFGMGYAVDVEAGSQATITGRR
ncbi:hypothetical protein GQ53DRAFT_805683 [Thozetella sp. PMI_491]|nr:hypothetical protein GQ53DRAFT_805683 [Thozetella sp. PMI_491]